MAETVVSVVIPCHNSAGTIERALHSVLGQSYSALEIITVDDASTDDTREIIRSHQSDTRLRLICLDQNRGPASARNTGIAAARGAYIAFLDADDEWMPEKLKLQVQALESNPAASLCGCDAVWTYPDGSVERTAETENPQAGADAWKALLEYPFIHTSYVMTPSTHIRKLGGFNSSLLVGEDQDLWIRLALAGDVMWIRRDLVCVHNLTGGYMRTYASSEADFLLPMLERHISALRPRLGNSAARQILRRRCARIGRNLYGQGAYLRGMALILRAIAMGDAPLSHTAFLVYASAPAQWLKRRLGKRAAPLAPAPSYSRRK